MSLGVLVLLAAATLGGVEAPAPVEAAKLLEQLRILTPDGKLKAEVGDYAVYKLPGGGYSYWRIAVVGKEKTPRGEALWVETSFGSSPTGEGLLGLKLLTGGDLRSSVLRAYFKMGAGQTIELDPSSFARPEEDAAPAPSAGYSAMPEQELELKQTPAGSFRALKAEMQMGTTLWLAPEVPVMHLVAARLSAGGEIDLVAFGHDAKDSLGKPVSRLDRKRLRAIMDAKDGGAP